MKKEFLLHFLFSPLSLFAVIFSLWSIKHLLTRSLSQVKNDANFCSQTEAKLGHKNEYEISKESA